MTTSSLHTLQLRQLGVHTRRQLIAHGHDGSTYDRRVASCALVELHPGVALPAGVPVTWEHRAMAGRLWVGGEAALARETAARVHELRTPSRMEAGPIRLLVHDRTFDTPSSLVVHRTSRPLTPWVTTVDDHVLTNATRTICDLAHSLHPVELRRLVGHAVRNGLTTPAQLRDAFTVLGRFRGRALLRAIVDELSPLEVHSRSELESLFLRQMARLGIPPTAMNHPVTDIYGQRRLLDAVYLPQHQPVELDSFQEHGTLLDWNDDRRRANAIILDSSWRSMLRYSWNDLTRHLDRVEHELRTALAAR